MTCCDQYWKLAFQMQHFSSVKKSLMTQSLNRIFQCYSDFYVAHFVKASCCHSYLGRWEWLFLDLSALLLLFYFQFYFHEKCTFSPGKEHSSSLSECSRIGAGGPYLTYQFRVPSWFPLQYSCLENPMDGGAWQAAVHGVAKSRTRLSDFTFTFHFHTLNPLQCSCLENPRDGGTWWAAVSGVSQSRTRLK